MGKLLHLSSLTPNHNPLNNYKGFDSEGVGPEYDDLYLRQLIGDLRDQTYEECWWESPKPERTLLATTSDYLPVLFWLIFLSLLSIGIYLTLL
jgi:hypothetical protein